MTEHTALTDEQYADIAAYIEGSIPADLGVEEFLEEARRHRAELERVKARELSLAQEARAELAKVKAEVEGLKNVATIASELVAWWCDPEQYDANEEFPAGMDNLRTALAGLGWEKVSERPVCAGYLRGEPWAKDQCRINMALATPRCQERCQIEISEASQQQRSASDQGRQDLSTDQTDGQESRPSLPAQENPITALATKEG